MTRPYERLVIASKNTRYHQRSKYTQDDRFSRLVQMYQVHVADVEVSQLCVLMWPHYQALLQAALEGDALAPVSDSEYPD